MRREFRWISRKKADFHSARWRVLPVTAYEIVTPLTVEECLIRLTGRTPPFGESESIARPHPFTGMITGDRITLDTKYPYSIVGNIAEEGGPTRFRLALVMEQNRWFGYFFSALSYTLVVLLLCVAIPSLADRPSLVETLVTGSIVFVGLMIMLPLIAYWLDRQWISRLNEDAPDVADIIHVFAILVRATEVRTLHPDPGQATLDSTRVEAR